MANNFPWDDKNFILEYLLQDHKKVKKIILDCECVQNLKIFLSANQVLYYGHMALVKLKELFVTIDHNEYAFNEERGQEFQTEANFLLFSFLQIFTPYRDIVNSSGLFTKEEKDMYFKNEQADFFRSLRNFQTHSTVPIFSKNVHKDFVNGVVCIDICMSKTLIENIINYAESGQNTHHNFKNGGIKFLKQNKNIPIYILANDFLKELFSIHKIFYDRVISKYGSDLDECEYYLKRREDYFISCLKTALKFMKYDFPERSCDTEQNRFPHLLRHLGGVPHFTPQCPEKIFGDHAGDLEKTPCKN